MCGLNAMARMECFLAQIAFVYIDGYRARIDTDGSIGVKRYQRNAIACHAEQTTSE